MSDSRHALAIWAILDHTIGILFRETVISTDDITVFLAARGNTAARNCSASGSDSSILDYAIIRST